MTWSRRQFFGTSGSLLALAGFGAGGAQARHAKLSPVETRAIMADGTWLGPAYWANRLQDWRREGDWLTCTKGGESFEVRTAFLLTREIGANGSGQLACEIALAMGEGSQGFGGFLIGIGAGELHPLSASLAQRGSGAGGGIMAVIDETGRPHFREHNDDANPLAFAELEAESSGSGELDLKDGSARLTLSIADVGGGRNRVTLTAQQGSTSRSATIEGVPHRHVTGGVALVSSPPPRKAGAAFRFAHITTGGARIGVHEDRALGPCISALYSVANGVLNMVAQFQAIGAKAPQQAALEIRRKGGRWQRVAEAPIEDGFAAVFRVTKWDSSKAAEYRIMWLGGKSPELVYAGEIRRDPVHEKRDLVVNMQSCVLSTQQAMEDNKVKFSVPEETRYGRYSPKNFNYPHDDLVRNSLAHDPDLVFASGDQYYEMNPTRKWQPGDDVVLDTLYRWYQWCISYAPLTKDRPTIVLVDDHDVLQGNLWGDQGRVAPDGDETWGGYTKPLNMVRMVHRVQCGGNPDPADPTPVLNDVPVCYAAFEWGGTEIAIVEDRKWKTAPIQGPGLLGHVGEMLGERQEKFLAEWAARDTGKPRLILTQTAWATIETEKNGKPLINFDGNGYPTLGRRRGVQLAKDAKALLLSGDQHMASLVRHGIDTHTDGPMQFTSPSGGTFWQRWFEPDEALANARDGLPHTGDWRDAFGNPMRVLAVANPGVTYAAFREHVKPTSQILYDRALKKEGYGVVRVDHASRKFRIECWAWDHDPLQSPDGQFPGWPYDLSFEDA